LGIIYFPETWIPPFPSHSRNVEWGWGQGGEMNQALYAHMNNKRKRKKKKCGVTKHEIFVGITLNLPYLIKK
jgi:hypothetical protein